MKIFVKIVMILTAVMDAAKMSGGIFSDNDDPFPGFEAFDGGANNGKEQEFNTDPPPDDITPEEQAELDRLAAEKAAAEQAAADKAQAEKAAADKAAGDKAGAEESGKDNKEDKETAGEDNKEAGGKKDGDDKADPPPAIKIGDKILTDEDMAKVRAKMEQKFGKERLEKMDEEELLVWTKEYVNILEGSKSINARFQDAAKAERNIKAELEQLNKDRELTKSKEAEVNKLLDEIKKRKTELEEIFKKQPKDQFNDDEVQDLKIEKKLAEQETNKLTEQETRIAALSEKIKSDDEEIYFAMLINELQANFPELQTAAAVPDILEKLDELDDNDADALEQAQAAQRVKMIFNGYLAEVAKNPETKLTITKYYRTIEQNLPKLNRTAARTAKVTIEELKEGKLKEYYKKLAEKQEKSPSTPGYGGGSSHSTERKDEATDKTAEEHWKSLGYNFNNL